MKKTLISVLSLLTLITLVGCGETKNPSTTTSTSTTQPSSEVTSEATSEATSGSQEVESDDIVVSTSATINLTDTLDLSGKLSHAPVQEKFIKYLNFHTMPNLFTKIEANDACEIKLYKDDKEVEQSLLSLGSRANNGYLTFHFSKEVKEVTLYARPCYKFYNNVWNNDTDVSIKVSVKDQEISSTKLLEEKGNDKIAELTEFNVKFDTPTSQFTVSNIGDTTDNVGNRLFLEKMDLEFNS